MLPDSRSENGALLRHNKWGEHVFSSAESKSQLKNIDVELIIFLESILMISLFFYYQGKKIIEGLETAVRKKGEAEY